MKWVFSTTLLPLLATASAIVRISIDIDEAPTLNHVENQRYNVIFKDKVAATSGAAHDTLGQKLQSIFKDENTGGRIQSRLPLSLKYPEGTDRIFDFDDVHIGYSGSFSADVVAQIDKDPNVDYIESDSIVTTQMSNFRKDPIYETEKQAPWGLSRISHRDTLNFGTFNKYLYDPEGGEGVNVYEIGTGINTEHVDFEGRARWGITIPEGDEDEDGNGHGTHCAGTIAGKKYGVAKKAKVIAVKVLRSNGSGSTSDVIAGLLWTAKAHKDEIAAASTGSKQNLKGSVANLSLGGAKSKALDFVVNFVVDAGVHVASAAGNDNADSCNYSPGGASKAVTVGSSALDDSRTYFSNYGKCLDIFAPGLSIQSDWIGSKHAVNTISGTSQASAHVAGLLAYLISLEPAKDSAYSVANADPGEIKEKLLSLATKGTLSDLPDSDTPNLLAYNGVL